MKIWTSTIERLKAPEQLPINRFVRLILLPQFPRSRMNFKSLHANCLYHCNDTMWQMYNAYLSIMSHESNTEKFKQDGEISYLTPFLHTSLSSKACTIFGRLMYIVLDEILFTATCCQTVLLLLSLGNERESSSQILASVYSYFFTKVA